MNSFDGEGSYVQMFLWANNIHIFTIVNHLTEEGHILQAKDRQVLILNVISQGVLALHIETTLAEY